MQQKQEKKPFTCLFQDSFYSFSRHSAISFLSFHVSMCMCVFSSVSFPTTCFLLSFSLLTVRVEATETEASARPPNTLHASVIYPISIYLIYLSICQSIYIWSCRNSVRSLRSIAICMNNNSNNNIYILPIYLLLLSY